MNKDEIIVENADEKKETETVKRDFRDTIYGRLDVSVKSVDKFIYLMIGLLVVSMLFAVLTRQA